MTVLWSASLGGWRLLEVPSPLCTVSAPQLVSRSVCVLGGDGWMGDRGKCSELFFAVLCATVNL